MYPAVAVLQEVNADDQTVLWVGSEGGMEEELVRRLNVPFKTVPAAGVHGVGLRALPGNIWQLVRGTLASRRILREFKPDVLFFTGGYVAVPMAVAGWRVPTLLYVPDIEPGLALKVLSHFADRIALTAEASRQYFSRRSHTEITGYPTRPELKRWEQTSAREKLGLKSDEPVVLFFGGSKGARSINRAVTAILPELLAQAQIVHIAGQLDWDEIRTAREELPATLSDRYHAYPYLHEEMGAALASADLVVSRAGASILGEFPLFGLPAILIPYPHAWRYQKVNASHLEQHGAALILEDERLKTDLLRNVTDLLNDPKKLSRMRQAMQQLAAPEAARKLANLAVSLAGKPSVPVGDQA